MATDRPDDRDALDEHLLKQGIAEMDRAWQQRRCPAPHRLWCVALGEERWSANEQQHLSQCPRCSARFARLQHDVQPSPTAENSIVRSPTPVSSKVLTATDRIRARRGTSLRLRFPDEHLYALLDCGRTESRLQVKHTEWPPGSLLRVSLGPPFAMKRGWNRLVVLRRELGECTSSMRVTDALPDDNAERCLQVQAITLRDLPLSHMAFQKTLCEALDLARADDPESVTPCLGSESAWQLCTQQMLMSSPRPEQRLVLDRISAVLNDLNRLGDPGDEPRLVFDPPSM